MSRIWPDIPKEWEFDMIRLEEDAIDDAIFNSSEFKEVVKMVKLEKRIKKLEEALQECEAYFEERADAEYFTDVAGPVGNREMTMLVMVQEALK